MSAPLRKAVAVGSPRGEERCLGLRLAFLHHQTTSLVGEQLSGGLRRSWPQGAKGWGLALLSHWPLSHQLLLRIPGLVGADPTGKDSAVRGDPHFCRDTTARTLSRAMCAHGAPGLRLESSVGRPEQTLGAAPCWLAS